MPCEEHRKNADAQTGEEARLVGRSRAWIQGQDLLTLTPRSPSVAHLVPETELPGNTNHRLTCNNASAGWIHWYLFSRNLGKNQLSCFQEAKDFCLCPQKSHQPPEGNEGVNADQIFSLAPSQKTQLQLIMVFIEKFSRERGQRIEQNTPN